MHRSLVRLIAIVGLLVMASSATAASAQQVTIRGRLERATPGGVYPAVGVAVTVYSSSIGRSNPTYAGTDGMYYIYNVPPGAYALEIWIPGAPTPMMFPIAVPFVPYFDIAPIRVP